jgi:hypothetical protein
MLFGMLHGCGSPFRDGVGQVDEELSQTALGSCIVAEDGRERGVAKGFRETLPQCLSGPTVVTQTVANVRRQYGREGEKNNKSHTEGNSAQHV